MDVYAAIFSVLTFTGTAIARKEIGNQWENLKGLIWKKLGHKSDVAVRIEAFEADPGDQQRQDALKAELARAGIEKDQQILSLARQILEAIRSLQQQPGAIVTMSGSGGVAVGQGSVAAGKGGVAVKGNLHGNITIGGKSGD